MNQLDLWAFSVLMPGVVRDYDPNQPRDEYGKWTDGASNAPELKESWKKRMQEGEKLAEQYEGYSYGSAIKAATQENPELVQPLFDDLEEYGPKTVFLREQFFKAGFLGDKPEYVEAIRYGEPPESGQSKNWATGEVEQGVSVVKILRNPGEEKDKSIYSAIYGLQGTKLYKVSGWYLGRHGSDGEPLLVDVKVIQEINK